MQSLHGGGEEMKAIVKSIEVRNLMNRFPVDGVVFSEPSKIIDVEFTVNMRAKDFLVTKDIYRMGDTVDVYLIVKKRQTKHAPPKPSSRKAKGRAAK
jgi:hypothetical protein